MDSNPFYSIIVPTHNRPLYLRRALSSIVGQKCERPFEVIVVSDVANAGTDAVCNEVLRPLDIYVRRSGHPGPSASRNIGLQLARGQYVLFLDDDDAWHPGCLDSLTNSTPVKQNQPVYFDGSVCVESRLPEGPVTHAETHLNLAGCLTENIFVKNQLHMSCVAFPRYLLNGLTFDTFMRAYEDWEFCLAAFKREMPVHTPFLGSRIFEVRDDSTDRRGSSKDANNFNAVLDYLYVYRRHPAPSEELKHKRAELLQSVGLPLAPDML